VARKVKDKELDTREARSKLKARGKPYFRAIERGLHIGYRKLKGQGGTWLARHYVGNRAYEVERIGSADDRSDADGVAILDYWQAVDAARKRMVERAHDAAGKPTRPLTVDDAFALYCAALDRAGRADAVRDAGYKYEGFIKSKLGNKEAGKITTAQFEKCLDDLIKLPPRVRTRDGEKQQYRELDTSEEGLRKRRDTANRIWTVLKAVLNNAFRAGKIASDAEWKKVKAFDAAGGVRLDYLSIKEASRLLNACDPEFRPIVQAGLLTGARYGAIVKLVVTDFDPDAGTVRLQTRKGKGKLKIYFCHLTPEGTAFFKAAVAGRNDPGGLIFRKADDSAWGASHQKRPMAEAVKNANIGRAITFHHLRHTWASHAVMNGTPLLVVAGNLGHTDTRMVERHYGHLAPSYRKQEILKGAPVFGITPDVAVLP
jgi:integrase